MPIEFLGIDTETTGLDAEKNQIIDICLLLIDGNFDVKDELHVYSFPDADAVIDPGAVRVNGYDPDVWRDKHNALSQVAMFEQVYAFIKPFTKLKLIAHNVSFDNSFLKQLFVKHGADKIPYSKIIDYHNLDTMGIAMFLDFVQSGKARRSYRLGALCDDYKITNDEAHTARSDIYACLNLLKAMRDAVQGTLSVAPGAMKEASYSKIIVKTDSDNNVWQFHQGMHKGKLVTDVATNDVGYIRNVLTFPDLSQDQRTYLENLLKS